MPDVINFYSIIVEHTENDDYWGDGGNGSGKNMLGQVLMRIRSELREVERRDPGVVSGDHPA